MKFIPFDANYFNAGKTNRDCVLRSLCIATLFGYRALLEMMGKGNEFVMGAGYDGGISVEDIDDFARKTGIITKVWGDDEYQEMLDKIGTTETEDLDYFVDNDLDDIMKINNLSKKRFMFIVRDPNVKNDRTQRKYHAVPVVYHNGEWTCLDVDEKDNDSSIPVGKLIPVAVYAVNKMPKKDSPYHYNNERKAVLAQRSRAAADYLKKAREAAK